MGKSKTTPRPVPSDDSKVLGAAASNVTPIEGRNHNTGVGSGGDAPEAPTAADGNASVGPAIILFGRDESEKPHASWFAAADAELATRAAGLMGYFVLPVDTPEVRASVIGLAAGRVFASGKAFVPFCREAAYEALQGFRGAMQPQAPVEPEAEPIPSITGTPQRWEDVDVGALVLANAGDEWGWHEAIVTEARGDDLFTLRWRGWPDDPVFPRRRDGLGLLPLSAAEPSAPTPADSAT